MFIQGVLKCKEEDKTDAINIRKRVFQDELGISCSLEEDDKDLNDIVTALVYEVSYQNNIESTKAVATGRLILDASGNFKIGRIAVLPEKRGKDYGEMVVRMLLSKAYEIGANEVMVASQKQAVKFYEKLGFISSNSMTYEMGIPHLMMRIKRNDLVEKCKHTS